MHKTTALILTGLLMSGSTLATYAVDMPVVTDAQTEYQPKIIVSATETHGRH